MIPHLGQQVQPLCIATAVMDGSANDRATKRQRGEDSDDSSNHGTLSTSSSTHSTSSYASEDSRTSPLRAPASASSSSSSGTGHGTLAATAAASVAAMIGKKYRRVTFAPVTEIHSNQWTRDVVDKGWYTKDELAVFKTERKALVKTLKKVQFDLSRIDTSVHCLRGYEAYFSIQANKEYKLKRQMVWEAVLQEQARQRYLGRNDTMMMQLVSSHATQWARDTATELGMQDAQVALTIFMEYIEEQQEDDLEDYDECDDDDDDAPIALDWNETLDESEQDVSLRPENDWSSSSSNRHNSLLLGEDSLEPLQFSSQQLNRERLDQHHGSSSSSHASFACAPMHHNNNNAVTSTTVTGQHQDSLSCLPCLQPYPTIATAAATATYMPQHLVAGNTNSRSPNDSGNHQGGVCNTTAARAS